MALVEARAKVVPGRQGPEQLKRSIDSLQRLYTIVVGHAVTEALRRLSVTQLALGPALLARVDNPYYGVIPRS